MLSFLHWRVDAALIQSLLPDWLQVDCFDGNAYVGLVPFSMERVRPWWSPSIPLVSWFLETNLRTYVRTRSGRQGVWFFSLDANQRLAVRIARGFWNLPYFDACMSLRRCAVNQHDLQRSGITYEGIRLEQPLANYRIQVNPSGSVPEPSQPGTLEHFLVERYTLFCVDGRGRMRSGDVHHQPYRVQPVRDLAVHQTVTTAHGIPVQDHSCPDHALYSPGVEVRISPLQGVTAADL